MISQNKSSVLLNISQADEDYYKEMWNALKNGDPDGLKSAISHLSIADLDRCLSFSAEEVFRIPAFGQSNVLKEDLSHRDIVKMSPVHYVGMMGDKQCLEILLTGGADPNIKDSFGQTPLHILPEGRFRNADRDFQGCLNILLSKKSTNSNRLDLYKSTPFSQASRFQWSYMVNKLREVGHDGNNCQVIASTKSGEMKIILADALLEDLMDSNLEGFKKSLVAINNSGIDNDTVLDESHGSYTLLQYACRCGMFDFVDELLKHGASPTKKHDINIFPAVMWATKYGYHKILQRLIQAMTLEEMQNGALRVSNETMETPLHNTVMCENRQETDDVDYYRCLLILLKQKQFLDLEAKNDDENTALHFAALCHDLHAFTALLKNGANFTSRNVVGLSPIHYVTKDGMMTILNNCIEFNRSEKMIDTEFWISLDYRMMDNKAYTSGIHNSPKCASVSEMNFLSLVAEIFEEQDVLYHPVLNIFTDIKWKNIRRYFYFNFVVHFVFLLLLISYISVYHSYLKVPCNENNHNDTCVDVNEFSKEGLYGSNNKDSKQGTSYRKVLFITFLLLTLSLWQFIQFFMTRSWREYILDIKNIIEVITVVLSLTLLFAPFDAGVKMGLASWVILFSSLEFILQLGQLPKFAVYVTMFNAVAWNFFKFICLFSGLIVAFSFSFFLTLQPASKMFLTFTESLLKTVIMTTGELEYSSLHISKATFPDASRVLLVLFVFLILLVLVNLLNGLAISDIQDIQRRAEVISCRSLIDRMTQLERALYHTSSRNPFKRILDFLFKVTLTFRHCLPKHQLTIYVSRNPIEYKNDQMQRTTICNCHSYKVLEKHIKALKQIVLEKRSAMSRH